VSSWEDLPGAGIGGYPSPLRNGGALHLIGRNRHSDDAFLGRSAGEVRFDTVLAVPDFRTRSFE
jgi:hypothetical protein